MTYSYLDKKIPVHYECAKPKQVEDGEWEINGVIIQYAPHASLFGKYEVFHKEPPEKHISREETIKDAIKKALSI